jgi:UDP-N-acetyl-D-mannosaminuronic acid dehydrogenase
MEVTGVEADKATAATLQEGKPHFFENGLEALLKKVLGRGLTVSHELTHDRHTAYIIAVSTPLDKSTHKVILEPLIRVLGETAQHFSEGSLVVLRSTVPVGTTRHIALPLFTAQRRRFYLAYCPERTVEGGALVELCQLPQIIGGLDQESMDRAVALFSRVTDTTVRMPSLEAAEMVKLIDNTFRDVNFAFANEIALIAERLGLDGAELIRLANLGYSRNNIPPPGPVGGACLSKDPYILAMSAADIGCEARLAITARSVNESLAAYVAEKLRRALDGMNKPLKDCKVFMAGLAFKGQPETDDLRDSPAIAVARHLRDGYDSLVTYGHDFVASPDAIREVGITPCSLREGFEGADVVIFMNNHLDYAKLNLQDLVPLMNKPAVFFDGWHVFDPADVRGVDGLVYGGLGVG